ncbi:MOSC domain-containing protein YiiM [Bosea sp. BE271]|jgi:MOSC domain-containing protein YiiM|uniref:MOSC domain-containing protein n=1 Tax=Bosea TaxID=85413 RepID=UPI0028582CBA|nr:MULTISPECIES: MOSC domain-containing protein [Bosea]MDR6831430.1 MOSC domain-containing protein YiiM [Bosea robiniae]MDR6898146.1 MOSC domain-containing protein YiiM [Bosea sp. BE109]MDR7141566.1 MOSC domain-containing protein YiiM [Bosea sp. BE168]MDR7178166.1 MOSC domain-containing protein YiiM [Bosea sp. BE271]
MPLNPSSTLAQLLNAPVRAGHVVWLGVRPHRRGAMLTLPSANFDATNGIVGDRYTRAAGPRQVTLVQAEHLAAIASHLGRPQIMPDDLRRNVVTQGINLAALKEKHFRIGSAILETTGECHPCSRMEEVLGTGGYNAVRGLGGITARIIESGTVEIGDELVALPVKRPAKLPPRFGVRPCE